LARSAQALVRQPHKREIHANNPIVGNICAYVKHRKSIMSYTLALVLAPKLGEADVLRQ